MKSGLGELLTLAELIIFLSFSKHNLNPKKEGNFPASHSENL